MMDHNQEVEGGSNGKSTGAYLCRQSSTRWSPTSEQIRILKDLYYNNGVRSPTADQIQRISAKLRQYGKIEGKNVFYWFQNHKARERQKKRFTAPAHHFSNYPPPPPLKFPNGANLPSSSSSPGIFTVGNYGYGSVAMEKSFQECTITPSSSTTNVVGGGNHHNLTWIGVDPYSTNSPYPFLEDQNRMYATALNHINGIAAADQTLEPEDADAGEEDEEEEEVEEEEEERETLPLFPMHGDLKQDINYHQNNDYINNGNCLSAGWHRRPEDSIAAASRASLELTLNSYAARFPAAS